MAQGSEPACTPADLFAGIFAAIAAPPALQKMIKLAGDRLDEKDKTIADLREKMAGMIPKPNATGGEFFGYTSSGYAARVIRDGDAIQGRAVLEEIAERAWKAGHEKGLAPLGGMTGSEFEESLQGGIGKLRKAMEASPSMTNAGVLHAAAEHFSQRAMGDALTRSGFVKEPGPTTDQWVEILNEIENLRGAAKVPDDVAMVGVVRRATVLLGGTPCL